MKPNGKATSDHAPPATKTKWQVFYKDPSKTVVAQTHYFAKQAGARELGCEPARVGAWCPSEQIGDEPHGQPALEGVLKDVADELARARTIHAPMPSAHHGYAVILEELDELWELVRAKQGVHDFASMKDEAVQIAAMAIRFIEDVCDGKT